MTTNTGENEFGRKVMDWTRTLSIAILLIHFYYFCYSALREWRLTAPIVDIVFTFFSDWGFFPVF